MTKDELNHLLEQVNKQQPTKVAEELNQKLYERMKTGLSREAYIRTVLAGKVPVEIPPAPYYELMREVHALGNSMNQLA